MATREFKITRIHPVTQKRYFDYLFFQDMDKAELWADQVNDTEGSHKVVKIAPMPRDYVEA